MKQLSVKALVSAVGVDLGDRNSRVCVISREGEVVEEATIPTTAASFRRKFGSVGPSRIVIETGTHSNWVHDVLKAQGHEVIVANARKVHAISANERKCDELDARMLARLGRTDISLLCPVQVRPEQVRLDLAMLRARAALVEARTMLVNNVRGLSKTAGCSVRKCSAQSLHKEQLETRLDQLLKPVMQSLAVISQQIKEYDDRIEELSKSRYPQTALLRQVKGVGPITALYFVLVIQDPARFKDPRSVGGYFGLVPGRDQSGNRDPELGISKAGDRMGRTLLVQCAHYIIGRNGTDCDLRRFGVRLAAQGGKTAKKRAVVATARKLAVLLFALLRTGEVYEPLRNSAKLKAS